MMSEFLPDARRLSGLICRRDRHSRPYIGRDIPMFDFTTAAVIYCTLVAIVFLGLWLWNDRRDHRTFEQERRKTTFHCIRCDQLYTEVIGTELARCPRCGHENTRLKF
jgi:uncharacterized paraquat-inducible protein A